MKTIWAILFAAIAVGASLGTIAGKMSVSADLDTEADGQTRDGNPNPLPVSSGGAEMLPQPEKRNPFSGSSLNTPPTESLWHGIWRRTDADAPIAVSLAKVTTRSSSSSRYNESRLRT